MIRVVCFLVLLLMASCSTTMIDFSYMHKFEEAQHMLRFMGEPDNREAFDLAHAHYTAANVAIADGDVEDYEHHITRALEHMLELYDDEPEAPKTAL